MLVKELYDPTTTKLRTGSFVKTICGEIFIVAYVNYGTVQLISIIGDAYCGQPVTVTDNHNISKSELLKMIADYSSYWETLELVTISDAIKYMKDRS